MTGRMLAHYEILSLLGRGGMGEVHRARDTKLGREVAIKLLPRELLSDPERVARFQREARTLASLNHPHIAGLHGIDEGEGQRFLVMELAEGEDLSERIGRGALSVDDALDIARQIALGLEEAHAKGIVHRDLKPANIKVSSDGKVKILDFGLARAFQGETVDEGDLGNSPTITAAMTQQGMVLGTAAYMSPEQAKGKTVDRRADLWSFGVILWEMLTGKRLFEAETTSEVLAAVLRADPPWDELSENVPLGVRRLLERCLERDPRARLQDIGEARIRLERWESDPTSLHESFVGPTPTAEARPRWQTALPWVLLLVACGLAAWGWLGRDATGPAESTPLRVAISLPGDDALPNAGGGGSPLRLSPQGNLLAYVSGGSLWLRWLDGLEVRRLEGTESVSAYDFSPDGRWLAFAARGKLYRISITGGAPIEVCDAPDVRGLGWVGENTVVFPPNYLSGLSAVSLDTGEIRALTTLDPERSERSHRWPRALPDGRSFLMTCQFTGRDYDESDIQIVSLESGERKTVYRGGSFGIYAATGHLLFVRDYSVFAVPLDLQTQETRGLPIPVLDGVETSVGDQESDNGSAHLDVSPKGLLIYRTITNRSDMTQLGEFDFESGRVETFGDTGFHLAPTLSPDGKWLAVTRGSGADSEIYLFDVSTRTARRLTRLPGIDRLGCWSPDSKDLFWAHTSGDGNYWVLRQPIDGSASIDTVAGLRETMLPDTVSADGRWLMSSVWTGADAWDVARNDLHSGHMEPETYIGGPDDQIWSAFSPDQKWMSYYSNESGDYQLYLRRVPDTGAVWQVTRDNQNWRAMSWLPDGKTLILRDDRALYRLPLELDGEAVRIGRPSVLAEESFLRVEGDRALAVRPDGKGAYVLVGSSGGDNPSSSILLNTNWWPQLRARMAEAR